MRKISLLFTVTLVLVAIPFTSFAVLLDCDGQCEQDCISGYDRLACRSDCYDAANVCDNACDLCVDDCAVVAGQCNDDCQVAYHACRDAGGSYRDCKAERDDVCEPACDAQEASCGTDCVAATGYPEASSCFNACQQIGEDACLASCEEEVWVPACTEDCIAENCSTVVELVSLEAVAGNGQVTISWATAAETDNAGFNVLRSVAGSAYVQVNAALIAARGAAGQGAAYSLTDTGLKNRASVSYVLQDVDLDGTVTTHGPVSATPRLLAGIGK